MVSTSFLGISREERFYCTGGYGKLAHPYTIQRLKNIIDDLNNICAFYNGKTVIADRIDLHSPMGSAELLPAAPL